MNNYFYSVKQKAKLTHCTFSIIIVNAVKKPKYAYYKFFMVHFHTSPLEAETRTRIALTRMLNCTSSYF